MKTLNEFQTNLKTYRADVTVRHLQRARLALHKAGYDSLGYRVLVELKKHMKDLKQFERMVSVKGA